MADGGCTDQSHESLDHSKAYSRLVCGVDEVRNSRYTVIEWCCSDPWIEDGYLPRNYSYYIGPSVTSEVLLASQSEINLTTIKPSFLNLSPLPVTIWKRPVYARFGFQESKG